ncbi:hypothetical protein NW768_002187 [Fusarium equiseti]|uniref:Uncharacterized protein n=1 Tax=Fusarium equiseti TaxID=61235 RepID=A0ABQ8RN78_FUSEQ|nr:hypothetical protein NW768_002187 [Fusarium equiseti]
MVRIRTASEYGNHQVPFKDHAGNPAIMTWHGLKTQHLPTLSVWVMYIVNSEIPENFDAKKFQLSFDHDGDPYLGQSFRFEFFFLPNATPEECVTHYRKEIASRGTVWRQIRQVREATKDIRRERRMKCVRERKAMKEEQERMREADPDVGFNGEEVLTDYTSDGYDSPDTSLYDEEDEEPRPTMPNDQNLPGLPWLKHKELESYRQYFVMCTDEEVKWGPAPPDQNEQALNLRVVDFDPVPWELEEGEVKRWDPMDEPIRVRQDPELWFTCWKTDRCRDYSALQALEAMEEELGWETC